MHTYFIDKSFRNAARLGLFPEVQKLIACGADPSEGLLYALMNGDVEMLNYLLSQGGNPDFLCFAGCHLLHFAVKGCYEEAVKCLLRHGADKNKKNGKGPTPLHIATKERLYFLADILLYAGASPNIRCNKHRTPLETATKMLDSYLVALLLRHDAIITKKAGKCCKKAKKLAKKSLGAARNFFAVRLEYSKYLEKKARLAKGPIH